MPSFIRAGDERLIAFAASISERYGICELFENEES
jgi:hypothetical protein